MEEMNVANTSSSLPLKDIHVINNDVPTLCDERETYDRAFSTLSNEKEAYSDSSTTSCNEREAYDRTLLHFLNSYKQRKENKARRTKQRKRLSKAQVSNRIIQIFACRMCNQTSKSQQAIEEHTIECTLTQHKNSEQVFFNLKNYLKINLKCAY